mmetsp:Transcript_34914/g.68737  ORF Transcript_34914/g.68737 Transcript_34914/m.68737 type:complete len:309 (+) Transcript_34914:44-970(+)
MPNYSNESSSCVWLEIYIHQSLERKRRAGLEDPSRVCEYQVDNFGGRFNVSNETAGGARPGGTPLQPFSAGCNDPSGVFCHNGFPSGRVCVNPFPFEARTFIRNATAGQTGGVVVNAPNGVDVRPDRGARGSACGLHEGLLLHVGVAAFFRGSKSGAEDHGVRTEDEGGSEAPAITDATGRHEQGLREARGVEGGPRLGHEGEDGRARMGVSAGIRSLGDDTGDAGARVCHGPGGIAAVGIERGARLQHGRGVRRTVSERQIHVVRPEFREQQLERARGIVVQLTDVQSKTEPLTGVGVARGDTPLLP